MTNFGKIGLIGAIGLGTLLILYLSWVPNPDIGLLPVFPAWLGKWTNANGNLRTGVPFVALAGLGEMFYVSTPNAKSKRMILFGVLAGIVLVAELGQLFLPKRHFDWADIGWGLVGTTLGMVAGYGIKQFWARKSTKCAS